MRKPVLLLDVGNTRVKWGIWQDAQVIEAGSLDAADERALEQQLMDPDQTLWSGVNPGDVAISSVRGPGTTAVLSRYCLAHWDKQPVLAVSRKHDCGLTNSYRSPEKMGVDRWVAMIGARARCQTAFCVADLGTATTLDAVGADGVHMGGLIAPGAALMAHSISARAPRVFEDERADVLAWANNTQNAVASGAAWSVADLVCGFHDRLSRHLGENVPLFVCGGAVPGFMRCLRDASNRSHVRHYPNLVLEGLGQWFSQASDSATVDA